MLTPLYFNYQKYMKCFIFLLIVFAISCKPTKVNLTKPEGDNTTFLNSIIQEHQDKGFDHTKPSIVVNGFLVKSADNEYKEILNLKECEIELIHFLNDVGAKNIYGKVGEDGIILITVSECLDGRSPNITQ